MSKSGFLATLALSLFCAVALSASTHASDAVAPTAFSWDGAYGGINLGVSQGQTNWSDATGVFALNTPRLPASDMPIGQVGGLTIGYNRQLDSFVLGVEADGDIGNDIGHAVCGGSYGSILPGAGWACLDQNNWFVALAGRIGITQGSTLYYGKAGVAYANSTDSIWTFQKLPQPDAEVTATLGHLGWVLGAGLEYQITPHWSAKAEYDYMTFPGLAFSEVDPAYGATGATVQSNISLLKAGLNYHFNPAPLPGKAPPGVFDGTTTEIGMRAGMSSGYFRKDLFDNVPADGMLSRLTWPDQQGLSREAFARIYDPSGVFAKGFLGGLSQFSGAMTDEDFPPVTAPYSETTSSTQDGRSLYGTIDVGYSAPLTDAWRAGGFLGYNHYRNVMTAYGCTQTATNTDICSPGQVQPGDLVLGEDETWDSLRIGVNLQGQLAQRLKVDLDAAWLPIASLDAYDNHWLRPDINPIHETAFGSGLQFEGALSYAVTQRTSLGVGGRYWSFWGNGQAAFAGGTQPENFTSNAAMGYLQMSYALGN